MGFHPPQELFSFKPKSTGENLHIGILWPIYIEIFFVYLYGSPPTHTHIGYEGGDSQRSEWGTEEKVLISFMSVIFYSISFL